MKKRFNRQDFARVLIIQVGQQNGAPAVNSAHFKFMLPMRL